MSLGSAGDRRVCICVCGEVGGLEQSSYLQGSYLGTGHDFVWGKSLGKLGRKRVKL